MKKILFLGIFIFLLVLIIFASYFPFKMRITLYIYNDRTQGLEKKETSIDVSFLDKLFFRDNIYRKTLEKLIDISAKNKYSFPIPKGTRLLGISLKDGIVYVNFSEELKKNHPGGSLGELLTIYSVVNTLTEFPEVRKVQILINGAVLETLAGHIDLTSPLERDLSIVK